VVRQGIGSRGQQPVTQARPVSFYASETSRTFGRSTEQRRRLGNPVGGLILCHTRSMAVPP
jgi:hypothetical protein